MILQIRKCIALGFVILFIAIVFTSCFSAETKTQIAEYKELRKGVKANCTDLENLIE